MWAIHIIRDALCSKLHTNKTINITWNNLLALKTKNVLSRFKEIVKFRDWSFQAICFKSSNFKTWYYFSSTLTQALKCYRIWGDKHSSLSLIKLCSQIFLICRLSRILIILLLFTALSRYDIFSSSSWVTLCVLAGLLPSVPSHSSSCLNL